MATARQRLLKEYKEAARAATLPGGDGGTGVTLVPDEANLFRWRALLAGPEGTPYEGGTFELDIAVRCWRCCPTRCVEGSPWWAAGSERLCWCRKSKSNVYH